MPDLSYVWFNFDLTAIAQAYEAGRNALLEQIADAEATYETHRAKVAAGETVDIEYDEDSGQTFDVGDYVYHAQKSAREMLNLHRQAFAVMIHHAWERHVCVVGHYPEYQCNKAYGELAKKGWPIDKPRLERLRMTANCVKHDDGDLFDMHPEMFDPDDLPVSFEGEKPTRHWQDALRLSDEDVADFVDTVRRSACKPVAHPLRG